jgi:tetratricopeptide (TPR) repeat protein
MWLIRLVQVFLVCCVVLAITAGLYLFRHELKQQWQLLWLDQEAASWIQQGSWQEATRVYEKALNQASEGDKPALYHKLGGLYAYQGEWEKSIAAYEPAWQADCHDLSLSVSYANALMASSHWNRAVRVFRKALETDPKQPTVLMATAQLYQRVANENPNMKAETKAWLMEWSVYYLRRLLAQQPEHPEANFLLGSAYQQLGQKEHAAMAYCKTLHQNPKQGYARYNLGLLLSQMGMVQTGFKQMTMGTQAISDANRDNPEKTQALVEQAQALKNDILRSLELEGPSMRTEKLPEGVDDACLMPVQADKSKKQSR